MKTETLNLHEPITKLNGPNDETFNLHWQFWVLEGDLEGISHPESTRPDEALKHCWLLIPEKAPHRTPKHMKGSNTHPNWLIF